MKIVKNKSGEQPFRPILVSLLVLAISGCSSASNQQSFDVKKNRFAKSEPVEEQQNEDPQSNDADNLPLGSGYQALTPLSVQQGRLNSQLDLSSGFSTDGDLTLAADNMPLEEFLHTVFGDLLKVNYVITEGAVASDKTVSLQLQKAVGQRDLFVLVRQLLNDRQLAISERDNVYYVHAKDPAKTAAAALGYGRRVSDVPNMPGVISQVVPILFNRDLSVERVLRDLTNTRVEEVQGQSAYTIQGERADIIKALDLLNILDAPAARGKHVALMRLTYISTEDFIKQIKRLMETEGLPVDTEQATFRNMVLVPLEQIGAVAMFAADKLYMERVQFWAEQLDQPSLEEEKQYFVYHPRYARASDLGESLSALIGSSSESGMANQSRDTQSSLPPVQSMEGNSASVRQGSVNEGPMLVQGEDMIMSVDDRSNSLIFYSTGKKYQNLVPMIKRLDVVPKQILLEATIAEVTLTDEFAMGLEFAIKNGKLGFGTSGAFGLDKIGGFNINYTNGLDKILAQLTATDSRVNLLSSPSLVVRDGVSASINVGSDIPTVGSTTINPGTDTQSTTVVYRKTGVELKVTPTISAQGLVVMQIEQKISNAQDGGIQVEGSSSVFERSISTEVIAQSGQSILLGGLISENTTNSKNKVPLLGDIPLLGALFRSERDSKTKTELIILITPKVLENTSQWQSISDKLSGQMSLLKITD